MTNRVNLTDLEYPQLEKFVTEEIGEPKFRAKQIFSWIYGGMGKDGSLRPGAESFEEMNNLPKTLREKLTAHAALVQPAVLREQISKLDGTRKFLFGLADGNAIESVFMKYKFGNSICVSSHAGCRMGCRFCASTLDGLTRNLNHRRAQTKSYAGGNRGADIGGTETDRRANQPCRGHGNGRAFRQLRQSRGIYPHHQRFERACRRYAEYHRFNLRAGAEDRPVCRRLSAGKPGNLASRGK